MMMGILFLLGYRCVYGVLARRISAARGFEKGFAWGFWLGLIGLIVVAFRKQPEQPVPISAVPETRWMCLACGARNPAGAERCQSCMTPRTHKRSKSTCPHCGAGNHTENEYCFACGEKMKNA